MQEDPIEILIVEDSPTQAERLKWILGRRDYQVSIARDGREALVRVQEQPPGLVISDVVMPEMDGYALCREIKDDLRTRDIPVILLTSLNDPADVVKGLEASADSFIFKPYDDRYLLARIDSLLANRQLHSSDSTQMGVEIYFASRKFFITSNRLQILNLLLSTYEAAVQRNHELVRVQDQLTHLNEHLDAAVQERTHALADEIEERKHVEHQLQNKLARLQLLRQITRTIAQRMDLSHVFRVVVDSVEEQLPTEFCAVVWYDDDTRQLRVCSVGTRSVEVAARIGLAEQSPLSLPTPSLARCLRGLVLHEPDLKRVDHDYARQFLAGGLSSAVLAPLQANDMMFGLLIAARRDVNGFSSGECKFLDQLSEHVALAANQVRLHGALQRAYDDLHQTQQIVLQQERLRALGQMASGIAHDINNAISPISLYTESLLEREQGLSATARKQLETIQRAIDDVAETVSRMREFYRPQDAQARRVQVSLNTLVRQVLDLTRARWRDMSQQRGIVVDVVMRLQEPLPAVLVSEGEIREALTNLVFNAVDAMSTGGTLTLRTSCSQEPASRSMVLVEVQDTGIGMDDETRRRCLEPFFTTKGDRGTGLGLAMVYGTVQRHGADIDIESMPGQGTTVRLVFPEASERTVPDSAWGELGNGAQGVPLELLLVDDDPVLRRSLTDTLQAEGHTVTAATGGQQGIDMFTAAVARGAPFDVVITDLGMPDVDGRQVAQTVKSLLPHTTVVMLTGWGRQMNEDRERPPYVDNLLSKPPRAAELREVLARCIPGGRA
jgi:signal transduction histidine kinase/DNA-binding response OmpR family regulator